ncbi:Cell wall-associated hydrolase, NlpC family [Modestobacter sp. DSM 44400]|nr:Cell wall-associated hydrolase, NlpC family [Modestobacter sp. DSM 44400]
MPVRRRATGRVALIALVAASGVTLSSLPATAAPETPGSSQEAAALVAARGHDLEIVTEQFNDARVQLETQQATAVDAAAQLAAADAAVDTARDQVRVVARSAYTGDQLTTLQAMLTSSSADQLLDRVGTLDTIAQHNDALLGAAQQATTEAAEAKATADRAAADAQAQVDRVATQQTDLQSQIVEYKAELARLTAEEQARAQELAAQAHAAAAAAAAAADAAAAAPAAADAAAAAPAADDLADRSAPAASRSSREPAAPAVGTPVFASSGAAQTAVNAALAQQGKPYVWAAAGPSSFDCSGLMSYAYAAAGISLPHSSRSQAAMGRAVSRAELQPGDLIAFYSPVSHIGMYIGNGQMVHAPTSGDVVKVASIDVMGSITAMRRIVG